MLFFSAIKRTRVLRTGASTHTHTHTYTDKKRKGYWGSKVKLTVIAFHMALREDKYWYKYSETRYHVNIMGWLIGPVVAKNSLSGINIIITICTDKSLI